MKIKEMQPGWHLLLLCAVFLLLMPIVFAVSNSFKTMQDAFNTVFQIIPARPTVQNYIHVFSKLPFLRITMNTFLIAATVTIFKTVTSLFAAYSFVYFDFGGKGILYFIMPVSYTHLAEIAQRHPKMKILVCHLLAPVLGDYKILEEGLRILALHNVWFDLAAVPWNVAPETYPYPTGQGFVKLARQTVGAEKLVWGTDVPSPLTRENYENLWRYLYEGNIFSDLELVQHCQNNNE